MSVLLPLFLNVAGREVLLVGAGPVAEGKLAQLQAAGARVRVVAPDVTPGIERAGIPVARRAFVADDLDGVWLVVAAATPEANREVATAAEARHLFVNAVDDPPNASAYLSGVVRRDGVTIAISTSGAAPALTSLLRQGLDALLPSELEAWIAEAGRQRAVWRRDRVPMAQRRPRLLAALNALYVEPTTPAHLAALGRDVQGADDAVAVDRPRTGHVSLVGAGPGDPALLTRRALARLRAADLVLYDALVDDAVLRYARRAQRFFVGKRAGRHAMTQQTIHAVMIRAAQRGRRVVRLQGGDPFVFGRGGEEALALARAGVSFDVVPGLTSAVAAPVLAGIPLTHRGVAAACLVLSGHDVAGFASAVRGLGTTGITLVVLMGLGRASALAGVLAGCGWSLDTPAAVVVDASRPGQQVWRGVLREVADDRVTVRTGGPGTLVIGGVVSVGAEASNGRTNGEAAARDAADGVASDTRAWWGSTPRTNSAPRG